MLVRAEYLLARFFAFVTLVCSAAFYFNSVLTIWEYFLYFNIAVRERRILVAWQLFLKAQQ